MCYPAPSFFGKIGFILAETIFYQSDFTKKTDVGKGKYDRDFFRILESAPSPVVTYSHVMMPGHSPRGCNEPQKVLNKYGEELTQANEWIDRAVKKIEAIDNDAIIMVLGDHGAFISNNCTWSDPDVSSREAINDNLGVLIAVKWPPDYDNRYDDNIHTLMDLSWYLLQYLSEDGMSEDQKPSSSSFLTRESENLIYKVTQDGVIVTNPKGYMRSEIGQINVSADES